MTLMELLLATGTAGITSAGIAAGLAARDGELTMPSPQALGRAGASAAGTLLGAGAGHTLGTLLLRSLKARGLPARLGLLGSTFGGGALGTIGAHKLLESADGTKQASDGTPPWKQAFLSKCAELGYKASAEDIERLEKAFTEFNDKGEDYEPDRLQGSNHTGHPDKRRTGRQYKGRTPKTNLDYANRTGHIHRKHDQNVKHRTSDHPLISRLLIGLPG